MNANFTRKEKGSSQTGLLLNLAEREFRTVLDAIEDRLLHHCDRPGMEIRILKFIAGAQGPTTEGVAAVTRNSRAATEMHLNALHAAGRIWKDDGRGAGAWYISQEGRHFLAERGDDALAA